jgi:hypothetical protein
MKIERRRGIVGDGRKFGRQRSAEKELRKHRHHVTGALKQISKQRTLNVSMATAPKLDTLMKTKDSKKKVPGTGKTKKPFHAETNAGKSMRTANQFCGGEGENWGWIW